MAEHEHGSMDISNQEQVFAKFIKFSTNTVIVVLAILVFLAIFNS